MGLYYAATHNVVRCENCLINSGVATELELEPICESRAHVVGDP